MTRGNIRVAMIIQGYYPRFGGAERQLAALAPLLTERGVQVHVLTRRYPGLAPHEKIGGVSVYRLPIPGPKPSASLVFTLSALLLLGRLRPDIIHAHELLSPATTAILARDTYHIPVVAKVLRGGRLGDLTVISRKRLGRRRIAAIVKKVDAFVVISREIDQELQDLGVDSIRRFFIPNGVDTRAFTPLDPVTKTRLRESLGFPQDPLVVFTGRLAPEKRLDQLIKIWPRVLNNYPQATLCLIGSGQDEEKLKTQAGVGVAFTGQVEDVRPYLQAADLFVLPSSTEGLSNALLEAMATGLPVVATRVGGAPDLIENGHNGWLIPPDDSFQLESALFTLLQDPELRAHLGENGRTTVEQRYSLAVTADCLRQLYDLLLSRERQGGSPPLPSGSKHWPL